MAQEISLKFNADTKSALNRIQGFSLAITGLSSAMNVMSAAARTAQGAFKTFVGTAANFEQAMAEVRAVSKLTGAEFKALEERAKFLGGTTEFTAVQVAGAMEELRRSGKNAAQILGQINQVMLLSSATGLDLSSSAQLLSRQLSLFSKTGLSATDVIDRLTRTTGASDQNISQLSEALRIASPIASTLNQDFEEVTQILGAMAAAGITGATAGEGLADALNNLIKPTAGAKKALQELGLTVTDVDPQTNKLSDIFLKLQKSGASAAQIISIFGESAGKKLISIVSNARTSLDNFNGALAETNSAAEAAEIRMDTFQGKVTAMTSAWDGFVNAVTSTDVFKGIVESITDAINRLTLFIDAWKLVTAAFEGRGQDASFLDKLKLALELVKSPEFQASRKPQPTPGGQQPGERPPLQTFDIQKAPTLAAVAMDRSSKALAGVGSQLESSIPLLGAAQSGFAQGGIFGAGGAMLGSLLAQNEKFQELMGKLTEVLVSLVDPIVDALAPALEALIPLIQELKPAFKFFGDAIAFSIKPLIAILHEHKRALESMGKASGETDKALKDMGTSLAEFMIAPAWAASVASLNLLVDEIKRIPDNVKRFFEELPNKFKFLEEWPDKLKSLGEGLKIDEPSWDKFSQVVQEYMIAPFLKLNEELSKLFEGLDLGAFAGLDVKLKDFLNGLSPAFAEALIAPWIAVNRGIIGWFKDLDLGKKISDFFLNDLGDVFAKSLLGPWYEMNKFISENLFNFDQFKLDPKTWDEFGKKFAEVMEDLMMPFTETGKLLQEGINRLMGFLEGGFGELIKGLQGSFSTLTGVIEFLRAMIGGENGLVGWLKKLFTPLGNLSTIMDTLTGAVLTLIRALDPGQDFFERNKDIFGAMAIGVPGMAVTKAVWDSIKGNFPSFHTGGVVNQSDLVRLPGMRQDEGLATLQAGETVVPAGASMGASNIVINVNAINPREQANEIRALLEEMFLTGRLRVA